MVVYVKHENLRVQRQDKHGGREYVITIETTWQGRWRAATWNSLVLSFCLASRWTFSKLLLSIVGALKWRIKALLLHMHRNSNVRESFCKDVCTLGNHRLPLCWLLVPGCSSTGILMWVSDVQQANWQSALMRRGNERNVMGETDTGCVQPKNKRLCRIYRTSGIFVRWGVCAEPKLTGSTHWSHSLLFIYIIQSFICFSRNHRHPEVKRKSAVLLYSNVLQYN